MSGTSTPKRHLESGTSNEIWVAGVATKRMRHDDCDPPYIHPQPGSTYPSRSSLSPASSFINAATQGLSISSNEAVDSQRLGLPLPLSHQLSSSDDSFLPTSLDQNKFQISGANMRAEDTVPVTETCFGMLKHVQIQVDRLHGKTVTLPAEDIGRAGQPFVSLMLDFDNERCTVRTRGGISIARVNNKTSLAMRALALHENVCFRGLVSRVELDEKLTQATLITNPNSAQLAWSINVHVSGNQSVSKIVAKELSKFSLFLQHPEPFSPGIVYENPQYFSLPGASFPNGTVLAPMNAEIAQPERQKANNASETDDEEQDLVSLMNNLPGHDYLKEADVDGRIQTPLFNYQKKAVDFLIHRESFDTAKPGSLWCPYRPISDSLVYHHLITGSKSPRQDDTLGGILGDDMGVGKTLSMITTIVSTMSRAMTSAFTLRQQGTISQRPLTPVKSTLVLVPSALLIQSWIDEIERHVFPGTLRWYKYHGPDRSLAISPDFPYDIVLSTYGTVTTDFRRGGGALNCFHWHRTVLDEAHIIRNSSTKTFKAVRSLATTIRWCMSGTPIQNSLSDLGSLVQFLRVPLLEDPATFRRFVSGNQSADAVVQRPNYKNVKLLLGSICLRRGTSVLTLLGATFEELRPRLTVIERRAYDKMAMDCKRFIDAAVGERRKKRGNKTILEAVLRLRMFCNTGLETGKKPQGTVEGAQPDDLISLLQQSGEAVCSDCNVDILSFSDVGRTDKQGGIVCTECSGDTLDASLKTTPSVVVTSADEPGHREQEEAQPELMEVGTVNRIQYPSKLMALLENIRAHYTGEKSLDLVGQLFEERGIVFARVDGDLSVYQRKKVLAQFHDDSSIRVLLITLGTGAVGLNNLSVASRIHILEPQWNPSVEKQAIGRALRLGQSKKVCVIRYIVKTSIEESVESRQLSKVQLALKGGLQSSENDVEGRRRADHLRALSRIIESTVLTEGL